MRICSACKIELPLENFHNCKVFLLGKAYVCKSCAKAKSIAWNASNKKKKRDNGRKHYLENKEDYITRATLANWQGKNRERVNETTRDRYWKNRVAKVENLAKRRAEKLKATPIWLSKEQKDQIKAVYTLAWELSKEHGEVYHVDHIVPLQGKDVCGLHVPWNLQPLPAKINMAKKNNFTQFESQNMFGY